jgi:hypothetical protein
MMRFVSLFAPRVLALAFIRLECRDTLRHGWASIQRLVLARILCYS